MPQQFCENFGACIDGGWYGLVAVKAKVFNLKTKWRYEGTIVDEDCAPGDMLYDKIKLSTNIYIAE